MVEHSSNFEFSHSCLCLSCVSHFGLRIIEFHIGSWNNSHSLEIRSPYGWACKLILEQRIKYIMFWVTLFYGKHVGHHVCSKNYVSPALKLDNVRFCAESTQNFQKQGLDTIQKTHWSHCKWRLAVAFFDVPAWTVFWRRRQRCSWLVAHLVLESLAPRSLKMPRRTSRQGRGAIQHFLKWNCFRFLLSFPEDMCTKKFSCRFATSAGPYLNVKAQRADPAVS